MGLEKKQKLNIKNGRYYCWANTVSINVFVVKNFDFLDFFIITV